MNGRHDVMWYGVFRGTEQDPRECGWCETCGCEVYDRDSRLHDAAAEAEAQEAGE